MRARSTRGKTKPGRLDALDRAMLALCPPSREDAELAWDIGFGAHPHTTLAWSKRLLEKGYNTQVLGLEVHPGRAAFAKGSNTTHCRFAHVDEAQEGSWGRRPTWIRAMNVLRQYKAHECRAWQERWLLALAPNGHLLEGTCCPQGSVLVAHWMSPTASGPTRRGLIFYTDFSQGFAPIMFGDRLPKDLRAQARKPGQIGDFLARWTCAWRSVRTLGLRQSFLESAQRLSAADEGVQAWENGPGATLVWTPPEGITRPPHL